MPIVLEEVCGRHLHSYQSKRYWGLSPALEQHWPTVKFTKKMQQNNELPFLDINLEKEEDGTISTSVYWKKTHTDQYLQFSSYHWLVHKQVVMKTLFIRKSRLSSSLVHKSAEERHVVKAHLNQYPSHLIRRHHALSRQKHNNAKNTFARVTLSYNHVISETINQRSLWHPVTP